MLQLTSSHPGGMAHGRRGRRDAGSADLRFQLRGKAMGAGQDAAAGAYQPQPHTVVFSSILIGGVT